MFFHPGAGQPRPWPDFLHSHSGESSSILACEEPVRHSKYGTGRPHAPVTHFPAAGKVPRCSANETGKMVFSKAGFSRPGFSMAIAGQA